MRLRALARALLPTLIGEDARVAVAITGSAARGDASGGSDLDLWCVSPKWRQHQRVHGIFRGADVTLLCDGPASAREERSFLRCEVQDVLVLRDPRGDFRAVRALGKRRAERTWEALCRNTSRDLARELLESTRGPAWNRLPPLREAAIRFAAAWVYRRRGWRTPRWRTLRRVLPAASARTLRRVLGLPDAEEAKAALRQLERARPVPDEVRARIRAGEWEEAVLLARRDLEREVISPRGRKGNNRWARLSPKLSRAVIRLHGSPAEEDLAAALRDTQSLARDLRVLSWFSPRVEQLLLEPGAPSRV